MSSLDIQTNRSFEERRKMMKKVEGMVAEAEATVTSNKGNDDEAVHVSDVSSSEDEIDDYRNQNFDDVRGKDVSVVYGEKNEDEASSLESFHGLGVGVDVDVGHTNASSNEYIIADEKKSASNNKNRKKKRNFELNIKSEMDIHRMPTPVTCGGSAMKNKVKRSLKEEIYLEKDKENNSNTPELYELSQHYQHQHHQYHSKKSIMQDKKLPPKSALPPPQDRSVASKLSASSANSAATPLQYIHNHEPIVSPPFTLSSPTPNMYSNNKSNSSNNKNNSSRNRSSAAKKGSRSERKPSHRKDMESSILSPPKPKSAYKARKNYQYQQHRPHQQHENELFHDMKQEIEELRAQFKALDRESTQRRQKIRTASKAGIRENKYDPEELFQKDVQTMSQKADAMADALHRNYARSNQIHEENNFLRKENYDMKMSMDEMQERGERMVFDNDYDDENVKKSPKTLLRELNPSDDYVKRKYPPLPKTPGTMFTTEFVEVMKLDVGEHAYLAEIMDRQWGTSRDYRP